MLGRKYRREDSHNTFRKRKTLALVILLALAFPVLVDSQTEGLQWGFNAGKKLYFKQTESWITNNTTTSLISWNFYLITQENYTIPDPITYFPFARGQPFFYNDTPVMIGYLTFAVPIGNWNLLETLFLSLYSAYYDTIAIIDDETSWGFQTTLNNTFSVETRKSTFSKTDGVLLSFLYEYATDLGYTSRSIIERISPPLMIDSLILVIGGSLIVIGLLGVYCFKRWRGS